MKNKLSDLQNHIFAEIEKVIDDELTGDKLKEELARSMALNELFKTAVANGALMAKCVDLLYGIPGSDDVPLIPKTNGDTFLVGNKTKQLTQLPRDDGAAGYKKRKQQPIRARIFFQWDR
jgi:hypothetical protein